MMRQILLTVTLDAVSKERQFCSRKAKWAKFSLGLAGTGISLVFKQATEFGDTRLMSRVNPDPISTILTSVKYIHTSGCSIVCVLIPSSFSFSIKSSLVIMDAAIVFAFTWGLRVIQLWAGATSCRHPLWPLTLTSFTRLRIKVNG